MKYRELSNEQRRQWLDFMQVDEELRATHAEVSTKYAGSMRWLRRGGMDYLHVKRGRTEKSLGRRSEKTEEICEKFLTGRTEAVKREGALSKRIDEMAPLNRALGLGRVPLITAKILRQLLAKNLLGKDFIVAGTNALWAYEAKAGIQFQSDIVATNDADLLWDPRQSSKLVDVTGLHRGVLGILEGIDSTFKKRDRLDFRAINSSGFCVDIIRPEDSQFFKDPKSKATDFEDDLNGAPIFGLQWLLNSPKFSAYCIAEDGYSVFVPTIDPRAFVLHKLWIAERPDRDPLKSSRDKAQAELVAEIAQRYLGLRFNDKELQSLPARLRHART
jgi:hypothetical protein